MKTGCVILAGGKSSRMGKDKALLEFDGTNFIEKIAGELSFFEEKLIARGNNSSVTRLQKESWKIIPDIYPEHGPMGGIHAALKECEAEQLFCVSCDMPFITGELAKWLCSRMEDGIDAVIAAVLPLPFVPAICTNLSFFSGLPIFSSNACVLPRPGILPFQQTLWIYSITSVAFIKITSFQFVQHF